MGSLACRHSNGVLFLSVQHSVVRRQRLRSTRRPEQGRTDSESLAVSTPDGAKDSGMTNLFGIPFASMLSCVRPL